ncbi:hypothetical protein Zm00014a_006057 [Zea mays]|jgi:hypothetical protein|uniref:Uncharacterized protein n=1 Tax=Zea mays TaxID=4577 RepID=A0A3L6EAM5_MAIZE|nr:hypothetical protein Zm00014a_006057 [Zea mays]
MDGRLVAVRGGSPGLLVATPGKPCLLLRALAAALGEPPAGRAEDEARLARQPRELVGEGPQPWLRHGGVPRAGPEGLPAGARERDGRRTRGEGEEEGSVSTW